jgi:hypothetical protein
LEQQVAPGSVKQFVLLKFGPQRPSLVGPPVLEGLAVVDVEVRDVADVVEDLTLALRLDMLGGTPLLQSPKPNWHPS